MKHATDKALDQLEPLLQRLRALGGLTEKKRGVFYRRSSSFLHFHEDPSGLYADLKRRDATIERLRVDTAEGQQALLDRASEELGSSC